jgi:hypothetical protein
VVGSDETIMLDKNQRAAASNPWNKGRLIGQKRPLKPKDVWSIGVRLQLGHRARDLAMFNLAIDSNSEDVIPCGCRLTMSAVLRLSAGQPAKASATSPCFDAYRQHAGQHSSKKEER